jgi:hypothetical protein
MRLYSDKNCKINTDVSNTLEMNTDNVFSGLGRNINETSFYKKDNYVSMMVAGGVVNFSHSDSSGRDKTETKSEPPPPPGPPIANIANCCAIVFILPTVGLGVYSIEHTDVFIAAMIFVGFMLLFWLISVIDGVGNGYLSKMAGLNYTSEKKAKNASAAPPDKKEDEPMTTREANNKV